MFEQAEARLPEMVCPLRQVVGGTSRDGMAAFHTLPTFVEGRLLSNGCEHQGCLALGRPELGLFLVRFCYRSPSSCLLSHPSYGWT